MPTTVLDINVSHHSHGQSLKSPRLSQMIGTGPGHLKTRDPPCADRGYLSNCLMSVRPYLQTRTGTPGGRGGPPGADFLFVDRVEFVKLTKEYDVVNLGPGFPDFSPPDFAIQAFQQATSGNFMLNQYTRAFVSFLPLLKVLGNRH